MREVAGGCRRSFVTNNLDTLLTALYVHLEDRVLPGLGWSREHRPGPKPKLSDAELVCLAVAQQLLGIASERRWIRWARVHLRAVFRRFQVSPGTEAVRSFGTASFTVPARVSHSCARYSFRQFVRSGLDTPDGAPHTASASALISAFANVVTICRSRSELACSRLSPTTPASATLSMSAIVHLVLR
jgi:hypothetical protein